MAKSSTIFIKGARQHNLANIDVEIPRNQLVVVTGVSGSGKSSLIMDTLFAEGQRRYVESLSSYARQFLGRMDKPDVDYIQGICPAIAVSQKVSSRSSRSTVGTLTEIHDYLKLLFARLGRTFSPETGEEVIRHDVDSIVHRVQQEPEGTKIVIMAPQRVAKRLGPQLEDIAQRGFVRVMLDGEIYRLGDDVTWPKKVETLAIVVDRVKVANNEEAVKRLADSLATAMIEGDGQCLVDISGQGVFKFSNRLEAHGVFFEEPTPEFFSFNNSYGACPTCEGFGTILGVSASKVIPNPDLSLYEGAVACWRGENSKHWLRRFLAKAEELDFPIHRPWRDLDQQHKDLIWHGGKGIKGLDQFFADLESSAYKIQSRVLLSRYRGRTHCNECHGSRLRKETQWVKVGGEHIGRLLELQLNEFKDFLTSLTLDERDKQIGERLLEELNIRVDCMLRLGLGYLTINRPAHTLSGGETQRINLTRFLGSNLTSSLYILDEPSIGLHPRDTEKLITVLKDLRDLGNTVVVVEHDDEIMRAADYVIDMGPGAGLHGGQVTAAGTFHELIADERSLTGQYLSGQKRIPDREVFGNPPNKLLLEGAQHHNLKSVDVTFPLQSMVVVCGVSGSGKSSLVRDVLQPALKQALTGEGGRPERYRRLTGDVKAITNIEVIDQRPLGRSSRSNPVTYVKAYDGIRNLFALQQTSQIRGYKPSHFSFNVRGGRCETCAGEGNVVVEMQFLADVHLVCEDCGGKRFRDDVLNVKYREKNISDVLKMSVAEAVDFFEGHHDITSKLQPLVDVGLGYVHLGQSSSTLSGGEAQRVKLASFLSRGEHTAPLLFIFDEPTTGLHFDDVRRLIKAFDALIARGHSVLVVEHHMDVIRRADWVVELGPQGGDAGGQLVFQGTPEDLAQVNDSPTAAFMQSEAL